MAEVPDENGVAFAAMAEERVFAPARAKLRNEALGASAAVVVVAPAMLWWRELPMQWAVYVVPPVIAFVVAKDAWRILVRGRDFVAVASEGIRVTNRRCIWRLTWAEISRVHRFQETIVFETHDHRRETLDLEGHDGRVPEIVAAIAERARTTNLRWVETLTGLLG